MKRSWEGSETERFVGDTVYEKTKYYTGEAKPYTVKKAYFTFLTEDTEGNEREFKEHEITTETKETVLGHLKQSGYEVEEYSNHIILNPKTDNEVIDSIRFENHFLFNEYDENNMEYALKVAVQIMDNMARLRAWIIEEDALENEDENKN